MHDRYLASITDQCFLNLSQILKALHDVLYMCQMLARLLKNLNEESIKSEQFQTEFSRIKFNFEKNSNIVFKLLSNFKNYHSQQSSPYLSQLLLRLDYNNYLTDLSERIEQERNAQLISEHH